ATSTGSSRRKLPPLPPGEGRGEGSAKPNQCLRAKPKNQPFDLTTVRVGEIRGFLQRPHPAPLPAGEGGATPRRRAIFRETARWNQPKRPNSFPGVPR